LTCFLSFSSSSLDDVCFSFPAVPHLKLIPEDADPWVNLAAAAKHDPKEAAESQPGESTCNVHKSTCNVHKSTCNVHKSTCNVHKSTCNVPKLTCNVPKSTCNVHKSTCNVHKSTCHRCTQGGEGGGTSCTPYKDSEKLPHKNAIKTTPSLIFSQPQVPPSKEFAKKPKYPPPWISNYCASK
jgi:hypothetical protein